MSWQSTTLGNTHNTIVVEDRFDMAEVNHFYDEQGSFVFDQVIYYNFDKYANRFQVVDWKLIKNSRKQYSEEETKIEQAKFIEQWRKLHKHGDVPKFIPEWLGSDQVPMKRPDNGLFESKYIDGFVIRKITVTQVRESHSQFDPELIERVFLEKERRKGLSQPTNIKRVKELLTMPQSE